MKEIKNTFAPFLKLLLFWLVLIDAMRLGFIALNFSKFTEHPFTEIIQAFFYSLRLDIATIAYIGGIGFLLLTLASIWNSKTLFNAMRWYTFIISIPVICIHVGEAVAYSEWNHKLSSRVFTHLFNPDEIVKTADATMSIKFGVAALIYILLSFFLSKKLLTYSEKKEQTLIRKSLKTLILFPFAGALTFAVARGGVQQIPINTNAAYYSSNYVLNDLSINSTYFFGRSYLLYKRGNLEKYLPEISTEERTEIEELWFNYPFEHDQKIFTTEKPNIVYIILESWSANAIHSITGMNNATPKFDELTKEGLLFDNLYSVSTTSEVGNTAILSGYPAIPEIFISQQPEKARKLPSLPKELKAKGYTTQYLFSGDLKYGNIEAYLTDQGFDLMEDEKDFPSSLPKGKLNYSDEALFTLGEKRLDELKEPFLQCFFTGSTHSPYDFPGHEKYNNFSGPEGKFMNSMLYADGVLHSFLQKMKEKTWFDNTIFVLIADHGHAVNQVQNPSSTDFFKIPCLIWGKPLKKEFQGKRINKLGSQADIVRTLSYQLNGDYKNYIYSTDLLNPNAPEFAMHGIARGYGFINKTGSFTYEMLSNIVIENKMNTADYEKYANYTHRLISMIYSDYKKL